MSQEETQSRKKPHPKKEVKAQPEPPTISESSQVEEKKKSQFLATGLEDYGRWQEMFKDHKPENDPPFRRGRIWA